MSYQKHNFVEGDILHASQLNEMDSQIRQNADDIEELKEQGDGGTAQPQTLGKAVYLGDSIGAGYGNPNGYGVVAALAATGAFESVTNGAVSGSTFGTYQVESSASGYDCLSQINRYRSQLTAADIVFLEYGGNDVKAVLAGKATYTEVVAALTTAVTNILALNATARIIFLLPSRWYSSSMTDSAEPAENYIGNLLLLACEKMNIQCINMAEGTVANFINRSTMWQSDHSHPLPALCDRIATHVVAATRSGASARCAGAVPVAATLTSTTSAANTYRFDADSVRFLILNGVDVPIYMIMSEAITMIGHTSISNIDVCVQWLCHYNDNAGKHAIHIDLRNNGSIVLQ